MGKQKQEKSQGSNPAKSKQRKPKQGQENPDQRMKLAKTFELMDVNRSGFVDASALEAMAERLAVQAGTSINAPELREARKSLDQFWRALDENRNGQLSRDEYIESMTRLIADAEQLRKILDPGNRALFMAFDTDGDGKLSREEYAMMYRDSGMSESDRRAAFDALDRAGDGYVSIDEFVRASMDYYLRPDSKHPTSSLMGGH
ncbi:MAG: EF-hand domain-containing protein [Actinocatenispora sp.]